MTRTELVSIPTPTVPLDGAFHTPDGPVRASALLFHGNTMNFYTGASRFLPEALTAQGIACLAFNRRGHDILSIVDSRAPVGGALQTAAEGIEDNRIAASWLADRGFGAPIVIGHSNGGTLAVCHAADHPETPALVLLSAHRGGPTAVHDASRAGLMARGDVDGVTRRAEDMVAAGRGDDLLLLPGWWYVVSANSYLDRLRRTPAIVEIAPAIRCPVLFLRGEFESPRDYPAEEFAAAAGGPCRVEVIDGGDHFYRGVESETRRQVADWLTEEVLE